MFCGIKLRFLKLEILYSSFKSLYNARSEFITTFLLFEVFYFIWWSLFHTEPRKACDALNCSCCCHYCALVCKILCYAGFDKFVILLNSEQVRLLILPNLEPYLQLLAPEMLLEKQKNEMKRLEAWRVYGALLVTSYFNMILFFFLLQLMDFFLFDLDVLWN